MLRLRYCYKLITAANNLRYSGIEKCKLQTIRNS